MKLIRGISFALGVFAAVGCYSQRPVHSTPPPQTRVIAAVTDTGTVLLANTIGPAATEVEGIIDAVDDQAWSLRLLRVEHRGSASITWNQELVRFPRVALTDVRERELDKTRSWMAGGLLVAGAFALARVFGIASGDEIPGRIGPEPPAN